MQIIDIYKKFGIPPNLQEHMLRVCSIIEYLHQHWIGSAVVDWDLAKRTALLHDLGNIVKFDFDKHPELLGKEQRNIEYWRRIQIDIVQKYGADDHEATKKMLIELGVDNESIGIILNKSFGNSVETKSSDNWNLKILYYADLRTLPFGIGSLEDRISDVKERMPKYTSRPDFEDLVDSCREIENQLQQNIDIPVSEINDNNVAINKDFLGLTL